MAEEKANINVGDVSGKGIAIGHGAVAVAVDFHGEKKRIPNQRPARPERFVGRERDIEKLVAQLRPGKVVTLWGPGGIGKSSIAAETVWRLAPHNEPPELFPDGVIWHTLYGRPQTDVALEHISRSFAEEPRPTPREAALRALAGKTALLALDGAEAADNLAAVLNLRGGCSVLVASRSRKDAVDIRVDVAALSANDALTLLQKWAGELIDDVEAGRRICELVGQLPLAVRLAGRHMWQQEEPATAFLAWLEKHRLSALDQGSRQTDSLPLLLARSLSMVSQKAQDALALSGLLALAPFELGVLAAGLDLEEDELRRPLGELVDYGLLQRRDGGLEVGHSLIYVYGRDRMRAPTGTLSRIADFYSRMLSAKKDMGVEGLAHLNRHRPHMMTVLRNLLTSEEWIAASALAQEMDDYLDFQGHWTERIIACEAGLQAAQKLMDKRQEGEWLSRLGKAHLAMRQVEASLSYLRQALAISQELGDRKDEGAYLGEMGAAYWSAGNPDMAINYLERALAINRETNDRPSEAKNLSTLGNTYLDQGQLDQAIECYEAALGNSREIGDRQREGIILGYLGIAVTDLGQLGQAIDYYEQGLAIARELGDRHSEARWLGSLGSAHVDWGRPNLAMKRFEQALAISKQIGDRRGEGIHLTGLGNAYFIKEDMEKAIEYYELALPISRDAGDRLGEGILLHNLGDAYFRSGQLERAEYRLLQSLVVLVEVKSPFAVESRKLLDDLS